MTPTAMPAPAPGVQTAFLDGEAVLYDVARRRPLLLNQTASAVWMLLDGECTVDEMCDTLVEIFGADPEIVRRDVDVVLGRLGELGLLEGAACLESGDDGESLVVGGALPAPPVP